MSTDDILTERLWRAEGDSKMRNEIIQATTKPRTITAIQWTGDNEAFIRQFINDDSMVHMVGNGIEIWNEESKDWLNVPINQYIIKGVKGEFYPCSPEVFEKTYERVI